MRIFHTSDWHAGRIWKGVNRLPELEAVLDDLAAAIERERVDLLLHTGDVFDSGAPSAEAERAVFRFLKRVGRSGTRTVVIAGNHDHPARLEAWGTLAELVEVRVVPRPASADRGGVLEIEARSGERAVVAAVPFASVRVILSALELGGEETLAKQKYADGLKRMIDHVCTRFRTDAVNLLLAHTHLEGAAFSGSERQVHLGEEWAGSPQALPANAHYVALGHIHRPQPVSGAPLLNARYAGSPLQLDFGEAGEEKSYVALDARPGQPVRAETRPYRGGKPLATVRATLDELARDQERLSKAGWLRVTVPVTGPEPDLNSKVRRLLPNAVSVDLERPEVPDGAAPARPGPGASSRDLYRAYCIGARAAEPEPALLAAFDEVRAAEEGS